MLVSIICLNYNTPWSKIELTLRSLIAQTGIEYEIIVADDGSKENHEEKLHAFFKKCGFMNYVLTLASENTGTVQNLLRAVRLAKGRYVKAIAPGDLLYSENTLQRWGAFMEERQSELSFCNAVYYHPKDQAVSVVSVRRAPANTVFYDPPEKRKRILTDYLLANDTALGAALMVKQDLLKRMLEKMAGRVRYAEDFSVRLMIFEGCSLMHFPENGIFYEYGTGISSSKSRKWAQILRADFEETNRIIAESDRSNEPYAERIRRYFARSHENGIFRKIHKVIAFPTVLFCRLRMRRGKERTPSEADTEFLIKMLSFSDGQTQGG